jgi:glycosyltransferase involved in cell wall biosynthesis
MTEENKKFKIAFFTNSPFFSVGYSTIAEKLLPLINKKYESCLIANFGLQGNIKTYFKDYDLPVYSINDYNYLLSHYKDFGANCIISFYDMWAEDNIPNLAKRGNFPWISYTLVDTEEICTKYIDNLQGAYRIIPPTTHAEIECKKYFPNTMPIIPLGVDTNVFKPLWNTIEEKKQWKRELGFDTDTFIIGLIGDQKSDRKAFPDNFEGIKIFRERHPEIKLGIYLHTCIKPRRGTDFDYKAIIDKLGLSDITRVCEQYDYEKGITDKELAEIYAALDVYVQCSRGEGFAMQPLEAAACGIPSLMTSFTATDSLKDNYTGFLVKPIFTTMMPNNAKKCYPDPSDIASKLELVYSMDPMYWHKNGPEFAKYYDWSAIVERDWFPFLEKLQADLEKDCINLPTPSEQLKTTATETMIIGETK